MKRTDWKDPKFMRSNKHLLDRNENCDYFMSDLMSKFINTLDGSVVVRYPDLRMAYSSLLAFGLNPDNVLLTNGAEGAIRSVIHLYKYMKSIAYPIPTYGMLPVFADIYRLKKTEVKYNNAFLFNVQHLLDADIIYLASPDNPTGTTVHKDTIEHMCNSKKVVILDETYSAFSDETALDMIDSYDNLYIVRSFSKAPGAAGIRLGMVISNKDNIQMLRNEKPAYEINSVACEYLRFMAGHIDEVKASIGRIAKAKEKIENALWDNGYECRNTKANFILAEFDEELYRKLAEMVEVAVVEIAGEKFIRITSPDVYTAEKLIGHGLFEKDAEVNSYISNGQLQ